MTGEVRRRSIADRLAAKEKSVESAVEVDFFAMPEPGTSTASFRIDVTGELMLDTAASVPTAETVLSELDAAVGVSNHLLCVPEDVSADEVEALAISVWNEAGWTGPGVLHLTEGATLEGPWPITEPAREQLGLAPSDAAAWVLRTAPQRGAAPTAAIQQMDEWARAFPEGMPVGAEHKTLLVLRRMARRLGGAVRTAGTGMVIRPDVQSAVNLRVYSPTHFSRGEFLAALGGTPMPSAGTEAEGSPHAQLLGEGAAQVIAGVRLADRIPRALRWESWVTAPVYVYELTWTGVGKCVSVTGQISRSGMRARETARATIAVAARELSLRLDISSIIDEDDFIVVPDELLQPEEPQHP